jgi:hypothetical protein
MSEKSGENLSEIPIILADVSDEMSLNRMAMNTRVLINCVGPYILSGESVIKSCLKEGTHYVDFSAEPLFIEKMQLLYNEEAQEKGVYIVSACGLESIPADMGVVYLQQQFNDSLNSVELYFRAFLTMKVPIFSALANYASWESIIYTFANMWELRNIRSKLFKDNLPILTPKLRNSFLFHKNRDVGGNVSAPYPSIDKSIMTRSQRHFFKQENKRPVQLNVYFVFSTFLQFLAIVLAGGLHLILLLFLINFKFGRSLLLHYPRFFSLGLISRDGPTEKVMDSTMFEMTFIGEGWKEKSDDPLAYNDKPVNKKMVIKLTSPHSAYGATCVAILLSAKTILEDSKKMPANGGVLPPGAAFANTSLFQKLTENGFEFEIVEMS